MKTELKFKTHEDMETYLFDKYPIIFQDKDKDMTQSCLCWGIDCDVGWGNIIDKLCERLTFIAEKHGLQVIADQVKEKYAGLRFYYHTQYVQNSPFIRFKNLCFSLLRKCNIWVQYGFAMIGIDVITKDMDDKIVFDIIDTLVQDAEDKSEHICENCGDTWAKCCNIGRWYKTLCKDCAKELKYTYPEDKGI